MLEITLKRGLIGKPANQRKIIAALGLHKYGSSVKRNNSPTIAGMLKKIKHLVAVRESSESEIAVRRRSGDSPSAAERKPRGASEG